ncbi:MAG: ABC transporter ATP-binding protein [Actinomycetota bacterium]
MITTLRNLIDACGSKAGLMRWSLVLSFIASIAQGVAYALLFPLFRALVEDSDDVWRYFAAVAVLVVIDAALRFAETRLVTRIYIEVAFETRTNLGEQLKRMPLQSLAKRTTGDLNHVLVGNVNDVVAIAGGMFSVLINMIVAPSVTVAVTFFVDWRLALTMLVLFPLALPLYRLIRRQGAKDTRLTTEAHADTASHLVEYTQGLPVLRATQQIGPRAERLQGSLARLRQAQKEGVEIGTLPSVLMAALVQLGIVAVAAVAVALTFDDRLDAAAAVAVIVIAVRFSEPLSMFANMSVMFDFMQAAVERISEILAVPPLRTGGGPDEQAGAHVEFRHVTFNYDESDDVLHDVSFEVPERTLTAFVGPSGSGKTTVARLLTRFADPRDGVITVGGVDVRNLGQNRLMEQFSVVFQDVYLFDDTIAENLRLAKPTATDAEVVAAAQAANCHDFISMLPQGYDTQIGEIGGTLSGGERQRISIARAILKDAPIVILDEPTSALDTESEAAVQRAIDALVTDKTVIVIAHRLSTIVAADQIIVLEAGRVVEHGNHDQLVAGASRYGAMWDAQRSARQWQIVSA